MRILAVNHALCNGCGECENICAVTFFGVRDRDKSAIRVEPGADGAFRAAFCDQCGECIAVCPTEALRRIKNGVVRLRSTDCVGCLACIGFCPTLVMYAVHNDSTPIKCIACAKCVAVCPTGALSMIEVDVPAPTTEVTRSIRAKTGAQQHGH
jgi:ferredoxin